MLVERIVLLEAMSSGRTRPCSTTYWVSPAKVTRWMPSITRLPLGSTSTTSTAALADAVWLLLTWPPPLKLDEPVRFMAGSSPLWVPNLLAAALKRNWPTASWSAEVRLSLRCWEFCAVALSCTVIVRMSPVRPALRSAVSPCSLCSEVVQRDSPCTPAAAARPRSRAIKWVVFMVSSSEADLHVVLVHDHGGEFLLQFKIAHEDEVAAPPILDRDGL